MVYKTALNTWGSRAQTDMMIEECGELITALRHFDCEKITLDSLIEEIPDVTIMAEQMAVLFGKEEVESAKERKLMRVARELELVDDA